MKGPVLTTVLVLLMMVGLAALVLLTRQYCPVCGRPVYFYILRVCGC